ncbi:MAG: T9SS type A sorting domain-containing protein [candidate division Zixibacteria bacterium]|nr:T9SS type A sorting domain-containing protein [candidate division Zixibacteria bacterium]MDD5424924.1 T9SS type A sorting domain-containing protein [candidate division Zixibacteria bacterium]
MKTFLKVIALLLPGMFFGFTATAVAQTDSARFIQNFYSHSVSVVTQDSIGGVWMVFIGTITPTLLEPQMILDYNYVGDSTLVLIYSFDSSYFTTGTFMIFTGEGILDSVESSNYHGEMLITTFEVITGIEDDISGNLPSHFELWQNYPNPFNGGTNITFSLKVNAYITLDVLDVTGRLVSNLFEGYLNVGEYSFYWANNAVSGDIQPSGVYLYRLRGGDMTLTRKMLLLK